MISKLVKPALRSAVPMAKYARFAPAAPLATNRAPRRRFSTASDITREEVKPLGINTFMSELYLTSLATFGGTMVAAQLLSMTPLAVMGVPAIAGMLASLGGVIGFTMTRPDALLRRDVNGDEKMVAINTFARKFWYGTFAFGSAVMMAPIFAMANFASPMIIPLSLLLTVGTFAGSSLYAMRQPAGKFQAWGGVLSGTLLSVILLQLGGLGAGLMLGPNAFSNAVFTIQPYIGIGLFTAFQAYDTNQAIVAYKLGQVDVLGHAMNYVLNLKNIFLSFVNIFLQNNN